MNNLEVTASISVSRFSGAESLVLRMSAGENKLKTSSVLWGSSQNCRGQHTSRKQEGSLVLRSSPAKENEQSC